jgi:hypothetical protein
MTPMPLVKNVAVALLARLTGKPRSATKAASRMDRLQNASPSGHGDDEHAGDDVPAIEDARGGGGRAVVGEVGGEGGKPNGGFAARKPGRRISDALVFPCDNQMATLARSGNR